jgi:hypothetical protein
MSALSTVKVEPVVLPASSSVRVTAYAAAMYVYVGQRTHARIAALLERPGTWLLLRDRKRLELSSAPSFGET